MLRLKDSRHSQTDLLIMKTPHNVYLHGCDLWTLKLDMWSFLNMFHPYLVPILFSQVGVILIHFPMLCFCIIVVDHAVSIGLLFRSIGAAMLSPHFV